MNTIDELITALREDKSPGSYYYTWQSNIAMSIYDELKSMIDSGEITLKVLHSFTIHDCCNNAAKRFLNHLIATQTTENEHELG